MAANLRYKKRVTAVQIAEAASRAEEIRAVLNVVDLDQGIEGIVAPIDLFHLAQLAETISRVISVAMADQHDVSQEITEKLTAIGA